MSPGLFPSDRYMREANMIVTKTKTGDSDRVVGEIFQNVTFDHNENHFQLLTTVRHEKI